MTESATLYDVIIIGGGPAGLSAAMYAARTQLKTVVLDKNPTAGALGTTNKIENYPGIKQKMKGSELLSLFRDQAQSFGAHIIQVQATGVNLGGDTKEVMTADTVYRGKTVIIATGAMGRNPTIKGEASFMGRGVSYCATCDAPFFKGKDIAVVGAPEEILEELDTLVKFARTIYIISKKAPEHLKTMESDQIKVMSGHRVVQILGNTVVESIKVAGPESDEIKVSGVFLYLHGNKPVSDFLYGTVDTTADGCIIVNKEDMSTSVDGVYAAGDVTCKKFRQVIIAAAEGCTAALSAEKYINKRRRARSQWS